MKRYPFEPFKFKVVEPIPLPHAINQRQELKKASYNLFAIPADKVTIDLLTDSGTGALSTEQMAAMMRADESYAGAKSWQRLEKSVRKFIGPTHPHIIPVHQGRAAEKIIAEVMLSEGDVVLANTLFDTTRANFEHRGAHCIDLPWSPPSLWSAAANDPNIITDPGDPFGDHQFKGDIAIPRLKCELEQYRNRVKLIVMTLTNNSGGGQPVSMRNIEAAAMLAHEHKIPLLLDACRIAENAHFMVQGAQREKEDFPANVEEAIEAAFRHSDIAFMSAKKDGLANMGGFIAVRDAALADKLKKLAILYEGFTTYGGMSGREMETIAVGLHEVVDCDYLAHRVGQVAYLHTHLATIGYPLISPAGGHAVYIDAGALLPHIPKEHFPGQALAVALYEEGGVRGVEIGSLMFGDKAERELVRLALPRRTYTQSHLDYVAEVAGRVYRRKENLLGFSILFNESDPLRHFSCKLKPL